jgi:putative membrane protein
MTDLVLACLHHLLAFSMVAILAAELATVRAGLPGSAMRRLTILDAHYGAIATLLIIVGILRVIHGVKGPEFYLHNASFWAKMAAVAIVAALSALPTIRILAWRKAAKADPDFLLPVDEARKVRRFLLAEAGVFVFIPIFAAAMARGYGS